MADSWIVSCNLKAYDVVEHFKTNETIVMKRTRPLLEGDRAFLYIGKPYSRVMYLCEVVSSQVDKDTLEANAYAKVDKCNVRGTSYMLLQLIESITAAGLDYSNLREHGVGQFQNPSRLSSRTLRYINSRIIQVGSDA